MKVHGWDVKLQKYVLEYKGMRIESNSPMDILSPAEMIKDLTPKKVPRETMPKRRGRVQVMPFKDMDRMNTGLGVKQRDVKEHLRKVAGETGKHYEEIGNDKPSAAPSRKEYVVDRNMVDHIRNTVD